MKEVELANGRGIALVDDEDFALVAEYKWHFGKDGYAIACIRSERTKSGWTTLPMHRLIMGLERGDGKYIDHKNSKPLDNQRENLRICSMSQNQANAGLREDNTSGYKGIYCHKGRRTKPWTASIHAEGKRHHLG